MEEYLQSTKAALASGTSAKVHAVMGNEACDLDSAVSALTYAYYLHKTQSSPDTLHLPVLNISRADYPLRTEVTFYLNQFKVTPEHLTFRDDLDLVGLHRDSQLTLTLVDHNVLSQSDSALDGAVVEVIDHHRRDRPENDKESVTLETVGSCCTLVAEKLTNDDSFPVDHQMAELLYGPIVLDTINLSEEAGIKTPKDVVMLDKLQPLRAEGATAQDLVYGQLQTARADVSALTTVDLLRKDMKALSSPEVKVVFSSVPVQLETFLSRDDVTTSLSSFAATQRAAVVIMMSLTVLESGEPQRQLAVYSQDDTLRQQAQDLLNSADPALDLSPLTSPSDTISAYHQGNVKASRKKVLPHLNANLGVFSHHQVETAVSSPSEDSGVALLDLSPAATDPDTPAEVQDPFRLGDFSGVTIEESSSGKQDLNTPSELVDSGVALLDLSLPVTNPETPAEVQDPFGLVDLSGVTTEESSTDKQELTTPSAQVDDLLGLELSDTPIDPTIPAIVTGVTTTDSTTDPEGEQKEDIPESIQSGGLLDFSDIPINTSVPTIVTGVTTGESTTDPEGDQKEDIPETIKPVGQLDLSDIPINTSVPSIIAGVTTGESTTDPQSDQKEDINDSGGLLDLSDTPIDITVPAIVTGVTTSESTTDPEGDQKDSSFEDIPESIKPGGLLDLDFFAPKEESDSDDGSVGSLDDYERDDEPKEVPSRSEQEVLDLLSDALQEEQRAASVSPDRPPSAADAPKAKAESTVEKDIPKLQVDLLDPFEHHEGVLIEASPLEGMTPDPSATPDTSQPTSPPSVSYPGTPPNSYMDSSIMDRTQGQQDLPSFMNADMVRRIHEKKAGLSVITEQSDDRFPFTPQNSVSDASLDHLMRQQSLPSFDNAEMVETVHSKRFDQYGAESQASSEALKFPYAPPNSFVDSSFTQMHKKGGPLQLVEQDFADRMNKKQLPDHEEEEEEVSSPLDEVEKMDLPTKTTGNVVAMRIAEEMKTQMEDNEIRDLVNDHSGNVVAHRIAQDMKAREEHKEITDLVNDHSGNVVAFKIAQEIKEKEDKKDGTPAEPSVWDGKMLRYTGEDETDIANQFAADVILRALEDIRTTGESLQSELARADGAIPEEDEEGEDVSNSGAENLLNKNISDSAILPDISVTDTENEQGLTSQSISKDVCSNLQSALRKADPQEGTSAKREASESVVTFAEEPKLMLISADLEGRPHSDSQVSETSSGGDSDLSWTTRDFVSRMRSDTGASVISGNSDDLVVAATQMDVARQLVDEAMDAAVDIVKQDEEEEKPEEKLTEAGEWDAETLKTRMDQLPEHQPVVAMDTTATSTSKEADDEADRMSPQRPMSLESTPKKRIVPNMELLKDVHDDSGLAHASVSSSEGEPLESFDDLHTPDDLNTPEALGDSIFEGELDWEDSDASEDTPVDPIPEYSAREEFEDEKNWRSVTVGDRQFRIDMKVIEPYKKVLSHGGYYGDGFNAILIFAGCYLPDKRRRDYHYVMDNLFLYVLSTLELLVVEDYMVVYFHGATPKQRMPSLRWLKRCYEMIDRRLRKNLKSLLIVHPTLWIKTIMTLTKPFISSKFSSKLKYVRGLKELAEAVPMEYIFVPDEIKIYQEEMEEMEKMSKAERKEKEKKNKKLKKEEQKQQKKKKKQRK